MDAGGDLPSSTGQIERWTKTEGRVDLDSATRIGRLIHVAVGSLTRSTMA